MKKLYVLLWLVFLASCTNWTTIVSKDETWISQTGQIDTTSQTSQLAPEELQWENESVWLLTDEWWNTYSYVTEGWEEVIINPINHATMVLQWWDTTMYIDPAEAMESYESYPEPSVILLTHSHPDHFLNDVLQQLTADNSVQIIATSDVYDQMPAELQERTLTMANGENVNQWEFFIEAVPAYNVREEAKQFHPEGRDNGYILEKDGTTLYISWDTGDTPELRALQDIDIGFLSMNLPYTMSIDSAIWAINEFQPRYVFPYHFKWEQWLADVERLKSEVEANNSNIQVILADWY